MNKNQKGFALILIILLALLVGAVGYFVYVKESERRIVEVAPTSSTNTKALYKVISGKVYVGESLIPGADPATFQVLNSVYGKDAHAVYMIVTGEESEAQAVVGADPKTFQLVSEEYAKDAHHVYWFGGKIPEADPNTIQGFGKFYYAKDAKHVYRKSSNLDDLDLDPKTFEALSDVYIKDSVSVYWFSVDEIIKIKGADAATFVALPEENNGYYGAQDKNHRYKDGQIVK